MTFHQALSRVAPILREIDALPDPRADDDNRSNADEPLPPMRLPERRSITPLEVQWHAVSKRIVAPRPTLHEAAANVSPQVNDATSAGQIVQLVADAMDVKPAHILGVARDRQTTDARALAAWLMRTRLKLKFDAIGRQLGGRNHTTAVSAFQRAKHELSRPPCRP